MQLILRHEGRERTVRDHLDSNHLTATGGAHLLDDIEFEMEKLLQPRRPMTSIEILEQEG